jgi:UDP-2,3-diacylglucosamine hydrolase
VSLEGRPPGRQSEEASSPAAQAGALGILAGGGSLPVEIAHHTAHSNQRAVHVIALQGEADAAVADFPHTWVNWGQIGGMVKALRQNGCSQIVMAGTVRRPNLRSLRPDLGLLMALPRLMQTLHGGDDSVLRRVVGYFEDRGFTVVGLPDVAPHLLASSGPLGFVLPDADHTAAIDRGLALLRTLGPFDVGQAVVATYERIVAIEGAGGTDAMLSDLAASGCAGGVLVKWPKPGQELRLDLPAAGPRTIALAAQAGLAGIAVQAGAAVYLERAAFRAAADAAGVFVVGLEQSDATASESLTSASQLPPAADAAPLQMHMRTRRIPSTRERLDIAMGRRLLTALAPHGAGASAVVARQYVLAVEACETVFEVLQRAAHLRQWGRRGRRPVGTLVLREGSAAPDWLMNLERRNAFLDAIKAAGLAGLVVETPGLNAGELTPFVMRLNDERLFLVTVEPAS